MHEISIETARNDFILASFIVVVLWWPALLLMMLLSLLQWLNLSSRIALAESHHCCPSL
jgi:hypothetical protein